jgi:hypothetical protein
VLSEARIKNIDDIQDIKDLILCAICYQVVTEERKPVECTSCQNQIFCVTCIGDWLQNHDKCPYCNDKDSRFTQINPILLDMIKNIKFFCRYKSKGCQEAFVFKDLARHEGSCSKNPIEPKKLDACKLCKREISKDGVTL